MILVNYHGNVIPFTYHYAELSNLKFELERYVGYLPLMMRPLSMNLFKYMETQKKAGTYEEVEFEMQFERDMSEDAHIVAYIDFCRANPRYTYLLKEDLYGID